jgi:hypothetical protein
VPTKGEASIDVSGTSVRACIEEVESRYPGFQKLIIDSKGNLNLFVKLFVNGESLERTALDASLSPDDNLQIVTAAAGG